MSNEKAKATVVKKDYVPKPRKATFTVETKKDKTKVYHPVNKRAHKWAKKVGKRTILTVEDMKKIKATKKVKLFAYDSAGTLKAVKV